MPGVSDNTPTPRRWDLFCRVVDNFGDAAVMWRLARQLSMECGCRVRLYIDRPAVLRQLVPSVTVGGRVDGVLVLPLEPSPRETAGATQPRATDVDGDVVVDGVGDGDGDGDGDVDVVVSGFHASLPHDYRRRMQPRRPVWINLEYLSAEDWIESVHCLPSPRPDGLTEHYFYPGFTDASGGLLREADLIERRDAFQADDANRRHFLGELGVHPRERETTASLLCYPDAPVVALAQLLADTTAGLNLIVPAGAADIADDSQALDRASRGRLRISRIPFLAQQAYDRLLWSCDLNFVRGEDSLVRAIWSGKPFVWQIYPQADAAHLPKLEAFLRLLAGAPPTAALRWWNGAPGGTGSAMVDLVHRPESAAGCTRALARLAAAPDLTRRLLRYVRALRASRAVREV